MVGRGAAHQQARSLASSLSRPSAGPYLGAGRHPVGQTGRVELGLFDQVGDALLGMVPDGLGRFHLQARQWGIKAWFDAETCPREHYEAQVIAPRHVAGAEVVALEVGFHCEHPKSADNVAAMAPIHRSEEVWRAALGPQAESGDFLGRPGWQRVSEAWLDPDLGDPELCFEIADRLVDYITVLQPLRSSTAARP